VVIGGVGNHPLDQAAVLLGYVCAAGDLCSNLGKPVRKPVTDPLEIGKAKHPRAAGGGDGPIDPRARISRCEELSQVSLHATDLTAQFCASAALIEPDLNAGSEPGSVSSPLSCGPISRLLQ